MREGRHPLPRRTGHRVRQAARRKRIRLGGGPARYNPKHQTVQIANAAGPAWASRLRLRVLVMNETAATLAPGQIARVRQRQYLVEDVVPPPAPGDATVVRLSCLD